MQQFPAFLIAIDTEGDDIWARPRAVTTRNTAFLPRFQSLCEKFGFKPTYLVNFEMVSDPAFVAFGRDVQARGAGEIGMHMHAWDTPPIAPLSEKDWFDQPYATEYPAEVVAAKARTMTRLLEDRFETPITSHRAGRWGFNAAYARTLTELGYLVDCSVTPGVTWANHPGFAQGAGGVDYTQFPDRHYWLDLDDIDRPGTSALLEVPMTIAEGKRPWHRALARRILGRKGPRMDWLRPEGGNLSPMLAIVARAVAEQRQYVQFTLHSSEFMPGGSPTFTTPESIESLYRDMEALFAEIAKTFHGMTLTGYAKAVAAAEGRQTS
jgi:hypothetical protein